MKELSSTGGAKRNPFHPRRIFLALVLLICLFAGVLLTGLVVFTGHVLLAQSQMPEKADAIVVVTGGSGRLDQAIQLLQQGYGRKLLISGVHPNYTEKILQKNLDLPQDQISCCIELDARALNTVANATQTAQWARKNGLQSLILVTSAYHMPRTLLEMRRAAPEIAFQSVKVIPNGHSLFARLSDLDNLKLLTKEYGKLLAAIVHGQSERLGHTRS